MSIIMDHLRELLGKELIVVCTDHAAYRGRLEKYDEESIVIQEVLELNRKDLRWTEPQVSPQADGDLNCLEHDETYRERPQERGRHAQGLDAQL